MDNLKRFLHPLCGRGTIQQKCGSHWRKHLLEFKRNYGDIFTCQHLHREMVFFSASIFAKSLILVLQNVTMCQNISSWFFMFVANSPIFHIFSSFSSSRRFPGCCTANSHRISKGHCVSLIPLQCHRAACAPLLFGSWHCRNPWVW